MIWELKTILLTLDETLRHCVQGAGKRRELYRTLPHSTRDPLAAFWHSSNHGTYSIRWMGNVGQLSTTTTIFVFYFLFKSILVYIQI